MTTIKYREILILSFEHVGVRVRGAVAGAVREAPDPVRAGEQLHLQDVLLPVHQLLLISRLHRLLQGQGVSNLSIKKT